MAKARIISHGKIPRSPNYNITIDMAILSDPSSKSSKNPTAPLMEIRWTKSKKKQPNELP
jgi:hypothetical protein